MPFTEQHTFIPRDFPRADLDHGVKSFVDLITPDTAPAQLAAEVDAINGAITIADTLIKLRALYSHFMRVALAAPAELKDEVAEHTDQIKAALNQRQLQIKLNNLVRYTELAAAQRSPKDGEQITSANLMVKLQLLVNSGELTPEQARVIMTYYPA